MSYSRFVAPISCRLLFRRCIALVVVCIFSAAVPARATVRCVGDVNALATALDDANFVGAEGTTWDIRLQAKTYLLSGDFVFNPPGDKDNKTFYLSGGWNSSCTTQTHDASATVLRGTASTAGSSGTQFTFDGDNAHVEVSWLRFEQFGQWSIGDKQCTLGNICPGTDAVIVEHNEFHAGENVAVRIFDAKRLVIRDNLFDHIEEMGHFNGPVDILIANNESVQFTFNTFADLKCSSVPGGIEFRVLNPNIAWHHNIMRSSCSYDAYLGSYVNGQPLNPWNNLYLHLGPGFSGNPAAQGNVVAADPKFVSAGTGNYHLQSTSPAVNAGQTLVGAVSLGFALSLEDLDGNSRPFGQHFDIGAYESFVNDGAPIVWKVTNTSDDDVAGSLRRAINSSNAQVGGGEQHIVFDIQTGSCPHAILLKDKLPDVSHSVFIDGYSQPGSKKNTYDIGSNAKICVLIGPGKAGLAHALAVPAGGAYNVQLLADGLAFGGGFYAFQDTAIDLQSGNYHFITGSAFGGALPSGGGGLGSLPDAVRIHGNAVFVTVGGSDPAARNYFGNLSGTAVRVEDSGPINHVISNNYIGVSPDALSAQQINGCGIEANGGVYASIENNTIDAATCGIQLFGATTQGYTLAKNRIGTSPYGSKLAAFSNGTGIYLSGGANQNLIGAGAFDALDPGKYSNDIRNNKYGGVVIGTGGGNSIRGNRISGNGTVAASLGIDLGSTLVLLANDTGDADTGPNQLQNYPVLKGSSPNGATRAVVALLNSEPNRQYRLDFYRAAACGTSSRPDADTYVGSVDVGSGASGTARALAQLSTAGAPGFLTVTATNLGESNTSELAPCLDEDTIFRDGLEL